MGCRRLLEDKDRILSQSRLSLLVLSYICKVVLQNETFGDHIWLPSRLMGCRRLLEDKDKLLLQIRLLLSVLSCMCKVVLQNEAFRDRIRHQTSIRL